MSKIKLFSVVAFCLYGNAVFGAGLFGDAILPRGGKTIKDEFISEEKKNPTPKPKPKKVVRQANSDVQVMNHLLRRNIELLEKLIDIMEKYEKE